MNKKAISSTSKTQTKPQKILVFPDLHQAFNLNQIEDTIERESPDLTVFLGDYFDQFGDSPDDAANTAEWLRFSLENENRVHLIGNHDLS